MDCADVHAAIRQGGTLTAAQMQHTQACEACRVLVAQGGALARALHGVDDEPEHDLEALLSRVQADASAERGFAARIRALATPLRLLLAALVVLGVPLVVAVLGPRPDLSVYPLARMLADVGLVAIPAALALWISLRPLHRPALPPWVSPAVVASAIAAMLVLVLLPEAHHDHPASLKGVGDDFVARARGCFVMGAACGIPALVWLRLSSRDAGRWAITAVMACAAALAGATAVFMHCPIVAPSHLLAGHATVLVPYLLVAWAMGRARARGRQAG